MKRTPLRRKPKQRGRNRHFEADANLQRRFWRATAVRGGCVMCRAFPVPAEVRASRFVDLRAIQGHHVVYKHHLKHHGHAGRLWDCSNGIGLCRYHHARHHARVEPVPLTLIPAAAVEFAAELGLDWLLAREYVA